MISVDIKKSTSSLSPLNTAPLEQEETTISFASLLQGKQETNNKTIQNGSLTLILNDEKASVVTAKELQSLELDPKITATMTQDEREILVKDAKQFLKSKIVQSKGFQKAEIDTLPKTLNELVQIAKKIGIDTKNLSLDELKTFHVKGNNSLELMQETPLIDATQFQSLELDPKITATMTQEDIKALIKDAKQFLKNKILESKGLKKAEIDTLPKTLNGLVQVAKKIGINLSEITLEEVKDFGQTNTKRRTSQNNFSVQIKEEIPVAVKVKADVTKVQETEMTDESLELVKKERANTPQHVKQEQQQTPLFKVQSSMSEITTQQIVDTKINTLTVQKNPKQKADDTLKLLLQGDKVPKSEATLTADFSVATAKVTAPHLTKQTDKSFVSLLQEEKNDTASEQTKIEGHNVAKADNFEVKVNEAKQMVKYLSQDVKSAIEDYKSPFTRVKVQLNPQSLGEVDVTIVQRGKNLHINLSSNNTAINTLAMNVHDLKVQLNNNGIQNASLNFNSNGQSEHSQAGQQEQQRQNQQKAADEYNYFETKQDSEENLSSLEIVVPYYA